MDRAQRLSAHGIVRPSELLDSRVSLDDLPKLFADPLTYGAFKTVLDVAP